MLSSDILPHDEKDSGADQTKLDGAGEKERAAIFYNILHDVTSTLDIVSGMHHSGVESGILSMIAHKYFMLSFKDDNLDPDAEVGCYHVHQAKPGDKFPLVDVHLKRLEGKVQM